MPRKQPKFNIIKNDIITDIRNGVLKPGDKVDSESKLKQKYGVSAITVRKAFSELINDGYLVGVQGLGTFVTKKQMVRNLSSISFSDELIQQGYEVGMLVDSIEEITDEKIAEILQIDKDDKIIEVKRVRLANNEPVAYHISYMSANRVSVEQCEDIRKTRSLYETLEKCGIVISSVIENYSVKEINDSNICDSLKVKKGYPSFYVKRMGYDEMDEIVEYARTYFNKDWYSVTVNIKAK